MDNTEAGSLPIKYIGYGLASHMGDHLVMNKKLRRREYRKLREDILNHEYKHTTGKYNRLDFINDMKYAGLNLDLIYFMLTTPSAWLEASPFWVYDGRLYIDKSKLIEYTLILLVFGLAWIIV